MSPGLFILRKGPISGPVFFLHFPYSYHFPQGTGLGTLPPSISTTALSVLGLLCCLEDGDYIPPRY
jgi:hypothetical protein